MIGGYIQPSQKKLCISSFFHLRDGPKVPAWVCSGKVTAADSFVNDVADPRHIYEKVSAHFDDSELGFPGRPF